MDQVLVIGAAAFAGSFAAFFVAQWSRTGWRRSDAHRARTPKAAAITLALISAVTATRIFQLVSSGDMAAGLGGLALLITLAILGYIARALRPRPVKPE